MFSKSLSVRFANRSMTLAGLVLLSALTGCEPDQKAPVPPSVMDGGMGMPIKDKPDAKPAGKPDLAIGTFNVELLEQSGGTKLGLCFQSSKNKITVANQGQADAGAYKMAFGIYDATARVKLGCEVPITSGTARGSESEYSSQGKCCNIDGSDLVTGHQIGMFACADTKKEVDESDEDNNCWVGQLVTLFAPVGETAQSLAATTSGSSDAATQSSLPGAPAERLRDQLDDASLMAPR